MKFLKDNVVYDTSKAKCNWKTGSSPLNPILYLSSKDTYYLISDKEFVKVFSEVEAAAWLLFNNIELPENLKKYNTIIE